jgi:hypothetical protein
MTPGTAGPGVVAVPPPGGVVGVVAAGAVVVVVAGCVVGTAGAGAVVVDGCVVVVVTGVGGAQVGWRKVSVSNVTAPFRARALPWTVTPVVTVIDVSARMFPAKSEPVPSVAELPTCQKTLHSWAPLISVTVLADAVTSVESVWKMKTELGSPAPSSTSGPVRESADLLGPA